MFYQSEQGKFFVCVTVSDIVLIATKSIFSRQKTSCFWMLLSYGKKH